LELFLSPFLRLAVEREEPTLVLITQSFEFSASHRLHCPKFTEEENQKTFGKCANLNGHGHNYVVDVTVVGRPGEEPPQGLDVEQVQRTVKKQVIDRFDHKHLNLDCAEFRSLNPSVENIARVIWSLLVGALAPDRLASIRVWETPKTYAEFDGVE